MEDPKSFETLSKSALNKLLKATSDKKKAKELETVREATETCLKSFPENGSGEGAAANGAAAGDNTDVSGSCDIMHGRHRCCFSCRRAYMFGGNSADGDDDQKAAEIFLPFKLAFDTKNPRVVEEVRTAPSPPASLSSILSSPTSTLPTPSSLLSS